MKRNAFFIATAVFALLLATLACGSSGPPAILDAVAARSLDEHSKPVDVTSHYKPEDTIHISVQVKDLVAGSMVEVEYKQNGNLYSEQTMTAERAGSGYYGFQLKPNEYGHMPGYYTADVFLDGALKTSVIFMVDGEEKAEIINVVLARDLAGDSSPIDPTTTFRITEVVSTSVEVKNIKAGSKITIVYMYEDGQKVEQSLTNETPGSGYVGFKLAPSDTGHPSGKYTVNVFVDGEPYSGNPVSFTITK